MRKHNPDLPDTNLGNALFVWRNKREEWGGKVVWHCQTLRHLPWKKKSLVWFQSGFCAEFPPCMSRGFHADLMVAAVRRSLASGGDLTVMLAEMITFITAALGYMQFHVVLP